ncbi:MAG: ferritin family protein [Pseudomonadota bacterium]
MEKKEILSALEIAKMACNIEEDGIGFYEAAAEASSEPDVESLFSGLARKELEHLTTFRNIYAKLDSRMGGNQSAAAVLFDDQITAYLKVLTEGIIFPKGDEAEKWFSAHKDIKEAVHFAINVEKLSILFYSEIATFNVFAHSQAIIRNIVEEEKSHLVILNNMLHRLNRP